MNAFLNNQQKELAAIIVAGVTLPITIVLAAVTGSAKFVVAGVLLFIIVVFWNLALMLKRSRLTNHDFAGYIHVREEEAKRHRRYFQRVVYALVMPLIALAVFSIVLILTTCLLFMAYLLLLLL